MKRQETCEQEGYDAHEMRRQTSLSEHTQKTTIYDGANDHHIKSPVKDNKKTPVKRG